MTHGPDITLIFGIDSGFDYTWPEFSGKTLAYASGSVSLWDVAAGEPETTIGWKGGHMGVHSVAFPSIQ